jgi:hypothetical protein
VLLGLLGDNYWGDNAAAVDSCVRSFLVEAWAARELAVAARGPAAVLQVEVDLESEHVPAGLGRVRVPVPIGSAAGAVMCWVLGNGSVQSATRTGSRMLWCSARRACVGFTSHVVVLPAHCRGVVGCVAPVLWQCMFLQVVLLVIPLNRTITAGNSARAHGARAEAGTPYSFLSFFLSFYLC